MNEVLRCAAVSRSFGALRAVDGVTLSVARGARHAAFGRGAVAFRGARVGAGRAGEHDEG